MSSKITKQIEDILKSGNTLSVCIEKVKNLSYLEVEKNSAIRLIKSWFLVQTNKKFTCDFEIALRDYLMLTKETLNVDYQLSEFGKSIGLHTGNDGLWVLQSYPNYVISNFAMKAATAEPVPHHVDKNCYLSTNTYIKSLTGFSSFKSEEQKLCVMGSLRAPAGSSVLVSMSTGGGKSLITQTVAFQESGLTIVIVPTVSLMIDQAENAREIISQHKDEIEIYNSSTDFAKIKKGLLTKKIKLLFLSPEALIKNKSLESVVKQLNAEGWLKNIIVDEAHVIFELGDSFRLDFQCVDVLRRNLYSENDKLRTFLLSATFNQNNARLLKEFYSVNDNWIELRCDSLRREIRYNFIKANSFFDKDEKTIELIKLLPHPMIVYVDRPDEAKRVKELLETQGIFNTNIFTGETSSKDRELLIQKWKNNDFQIMIATCAFGVGVDKKDVRTVLHLYMPDNINKYYQEAGRGGRDGNSSLSVILYVKEDETGAFSFIRRKVLTTDKIKGRWFSMLNGVTSKKHGDGTVTLDTSIKPNYNEQDELITNLNSRDIDWNVYVLLFMKRHNLIEIEAVEYFENNYHILVRLKDKNLFKENQAIIDTITLYREHEWADTEKAYKDMIKFLSKSNTQCVSDILIEQYSLIPYEYCSGCNSHTDHIVKGAYNGLPLVSSNSLKYDLSDKYDIDTSLLIIRTNDFDSLESKLMDKGLKTLVVEDDRKPQFTCQELSDCIVFSMDEFRKIVNGNEFFMSKTILIECPSEESQIIRVLQMIDRIRLKSTIKTILATKENYYIPTFNKMLYEIVESSYTEDYMFN